MSKAERLLWNAMGLLFASLGLMALHRHLHPLTEFLIVLALIPLRVTSGRGR